MKEAIIQKGEKVTGVWADETRKTGVALHGNGGIGIWLQTTYVTFSADSLNASTKGGKQKVTLNTVPLSDDFIYVSAGRYEGSSASIQCGVQDLYDLQRAVNAAIEYMQKKS